MILKVLLFFIFAYLLGSVNASIIICKFKGIDIKKVGSGNAGATNTVRALGKKYGILVFLFDFFKGFVPCIIAKNSGCGDYTAVVGIGALLGHIFPLYFKFKGGKGVSTAFGVMTAVDVRIALILGAFILLMIVITKIVSVSTLTTFILYPLVTLLFSKGENIKSVYFAGIYTIIIFITHRQNIIRLLNGTENKFGKK